MEIAMIFQMKIYIYTFYRRFGNFCCNVVPASTPPVTKTLTFLARSCILRLQNFHHRFLKKTFENMQINRKNIFLIFFVVWCFHFAYKKTTLYHSARFCFSKIQQNHKKRSKLSIFQRNSMVTWHREAQIS